MTTWTKIDSSKIENNAKYIRDGKAFIRAIDNFGNEADFELKLYGYGTSDIDPDRDTVVLIHGWLGSDKTAVFEDIHGKTNTDLTNLNAPYIPQLADNLSDYQVLYLDWSSAALESGVRIPNDAAGRILRVSDFVSDQLRPLNKSITLVGHSLGALMAAAIGQQINGQEEVKIISLDAAFPAKNYDLDGGDGTTRAQDLSNRSASDFSIAFVAPDATIDYTGFAGDNDYARTADRSFSISFDGGTGDIEGKGHSAVQNVFNEILSEVGAPNKLELFEQFLKSHVTDDISYDGFINTRVSGRDIDIKSLTWQERFSGFGGRFMNRSTLGSKGETIRITSRTFAPVEDTGVTAQLTSADRNDIIFGFGGPDQIWGDENEQDFGNDVLDGGKGNDQLYGMSGDDTLIGGEGTDVLDGGDGTDTAVFSDIFANYDYSENNGTITIAHTRGTKKDGTDLLFSIEKAQFADKLIPLPLRDGPLVKNSKSIVNPSDNSIFGSISLELPTYTFTSAVDYTITISAAGAGAGTQYNFGYIIDVSGSMSGTRISQAKSAYTDLTDFLISEGIADVSQFVVIPFESSATFNGPFDAEETKAFIDGLNAGGGTSFQPALEQALSFFTGLSDGATNIVYFLSDGEPFDFGSYDQEAKQLQSIANVRAFGIPGANLSTLNIIDSTGVAKEVSNADALRDQFALSGISKDEIKEVQILLDTNLQDDKAGILVQSISPENLIETSLGLSFTGSINDLNLTGSADNLVTARVIFKDSNLDTSVDFRISEDGALSAAPGGDQVVFGATQTLFDARSLTGNTTITGNNLNNTIYGNTGNNIIITGAGRNIIYPGGGDNRITGGPDIDTVVYTETLAQRGPVRRVGGVITVGTGTDTLTDIEFIEFADVRLDTTTLAPTPVVTGNNVRISEGDSGIGLANFTFNLSFSSQQDISFAYQTFDRSATTGSDYAEASGQVVIPAGSTSASVTIDIVGDDIYEADEEFGLRLSGLTGASFENNAGELNLSAVILNDDNSQPIDIFLTSQTIPENLAKEESIGRLIATDPDGDTQFVYSFVSGEGDQDNASFLIGSNDLFSTQNIDFESKDKYSVRIQADDGKGGIFAKVFVISVLDQNEPPVALALTNTVSSLAENTSTASRIKVADIVITDDALGTNLITLAGADAASFEVIGTELFLKAGTVLDFETKSAYAVTVSVSDPSLPGSTPVSAAFTLNIDDVSDPGPTNSINLTTPNQQIITFAADPGSPLPTIASVSNPDLSGLPAGIRLDQGIYAINYDDVPIGGSVTLTLFLPPGSNVNSYWKYGPPSQGAAEQWYDFRFDPLTETGATFQDLNGDGQNEVILRFRDGLRGDSDFAVNGRIIDPGAPAFDPSLLSPPTPKPPISPGEPRPPSRPQPPTEPIPGVPSQRKPNIIRATADIDRLTGTPRRDIFVFSGVQSTSSRKTVGFDTIIDFQSSDRIRIRNFNQKVISNPGNRKINALQGTANNELSFDAINKTLGKDFRGQAIGAFEVEGYSGTFLAVNGGRRKIEGGRPGFDRRDMLLFLEGYDLGQQGPIVLA